MRKIALGLELKGLSYEATDTLQSDFRPELERLNPRRDVPVLRDGELLVVNSSDILQYLEWRYPHPPLYPASIEERVAARALERLADQRLDPIVVDCTLWRWTKHSDEPPPRLLSVGQRDLDVTLTRLQRELEQRDKPWPFGTPGLVECAWFPNLIAVRPLGLQIDADRFSTVLNWLDAMCGHPVFVKTLASNNDERTRVSWNGERLEWLLARGFHEWLADEIRAGRTTFPD